MPYHFSLMLIFQLSFIATKQFGSVCDDYLFKDSTAALGEFSHLKFAVHRDFN